MYLTKVASSYDVKVTLAHSPDQTPYMGKDELSKRRKLLFSLWTQQASGHNKIKSSLLQNEIARSDEFLFK